MKKKKNILARMMDRIFIAFAGSGLSLRNLPDYGKKRSNHGRLVKTRPPIR